MTEPPLTELADALFEIASEEVCRLDELRRRARLRKSKLRPTLEAVQRMERRTLCAVIAHEKLRRIAAMQLEMLVVGGADAVSAQMDGRANTGTQAA